MIGVGTGSTVNCFIDALAAMPQRIAGAVSSSQASTARLREHGIEAVVTEAHVHYGAAARFDDRLLLHARCAHARGARFRFEYLLEREDGARVAHGWTGHATVDARTFRPTRVPDWLVEALEAATGAVTQVSPEAAEARSRAART